MLRDSPFPPLLRQTLFCLLVCIGLVAVCYFWIDRPVAFFVHDQGINQHAVLKWLTWPPPILQAWSPVVLAALAARRAFGPFGKWERTLLAAAIALVLADQFRESLSAVFGRDWPDTWIEDNPSLIQNGAYGFNLFHGSERFGSFPSGHTARVLALVAVYWIAYPRSRGLGVLAATATAVGLVGMNYHFVGDVLAGGFVGALVGCYAACFAGLDGTNDRRSGLK